MAFENKRFCFNLDCSKTEDDYKDENIKKEKIKLQLCSNCKIAEFCGKTCQEQAWKEGHKYQDLKASPEKPIWSMVDVKLIQIFPQEISLEQLRGVKALEGLELLRRGSRLSVHPVSAAHFKVFERLAKQK